MPFYHAGYYLMKLRPIGFGSQVSKQIFTCSTCINDSLLDFWSYSWATPRDSDKEEMEGLELTDEKIKSLREWVDKAFENKRIGWPNLFRDLETLREYSDRFFPEISGKQIISIYFSKPESADLLSEFKPKKENFGTVGLYDGLQKMVPEETLTEEKFIGFDIIGIEGNGDFHSFHCHDISGDLIERFHLTKNQYGLFEDTRDWQPVVDYMNAEETGCEPVPWYFCKLKLVTEKGVDN
jgi:hypothetical protein